MSVHEIGWEDWAWVGAVRKPSGTSLKFVKSCGPFFFPIYMLLSHALRFWFCSEIFRQSNALSAPGHHVLSFPLSFYFSPSAVFFSSPWPSFTTCPCHYVLPVTYPSLSSLPIPLYLKEIFLRFLFRKKIPLPPYFTPTAEHRFSNFDEDSPVKLLLSDL